MSFKLYDYQSDAIRCLKTGSILCGGVGSGKSRTSLAYFFQYQCGGSLRSLECGEIPVLKTPKNLYIITTAKKRDTLEWEEEMIPFFLSTNPDISIQHVSVTVDSWNNIGKYIDVSDSFFIFDEQRLIGSGAWVKSFYKIAKKNDWILLTATPGDTWLDYIPVFVANGFYKNKTEFVREHVVFNQFTKYPKVERFIECAKLIRFRNMVLVHMKYTKPTEMHFEYVPVGYAKDIYDKVVKTRWDIFKDEPIRDGSAYAAVLRKIVNSSKHRKSEVRRYIKRIPKLIIFYNFDYELEILRKVCEEIEIPFSEWNGHKHNPIPKTDRWVYLVQYSAGAEGWNCIETNAILFYSQNHSYKIMTQASGRIDRVNTPFRDLYCYVLYSDSSIDRRIKRCYEEKRDFNIFDAQEMFAGTNSQ